MRFAMVQQGLEVRMVVLMTLKMEVISAVMVALTMAAVAVTTAARKA